MRSWRRSFWSLMATQYQGAFSDHAFKTLVIFLIIGTSQGRDQVLLVGALFAVPFILFSMAGGYLADRYSKRSVTLGTKLLEILVMSLGAVGLAFGIVAVKVAAVFLMGVQSALFGPAKYGLLPELLPERRLSWGNGLIQMGTFLAIISGTVAGGWLSESVQGHHGLSGLAFVLLGCLGFLCALGIARNPPAAPSRKMEWNFLADLLHQVRIIRSNRTLWLCTVGYSYFYFLAALVQFNVLFYGQRILQVSDFDNSLLLASTAVGIGIGSLLAGYLSGGKIEYGLIPLGSMGLTVSLALLFLPQWGYTTVIGLLGSLGLFSGCFLVPLYALIQHLPSEENRGGVIAAANLLSMVGVLLSSIAYYALDIAGLEIRTIFLALAVLTLCITLYIVWLLPDSLLRLVLWILSRTLYNLRVRGRRHIPERGGALFVSNHLSFADALLLIASTDRFIRFVMFKGFYDYPIIHPFARLMKAIPVASGQRPRDLVRSLRTASQALRDGETVCIFAEGQMTRIGQLLPFRRGMERIVAGTGVPIVPVHLDGVWGSLFSFERGRFFWKIPRRLRLPVTVRYGPPLSSETPASAVRRAVQELDSEAYQDRRPSLPTPLKSFLRICRRRPWRLAVADDRDRRLSFVGLRAEAFLTAWRLRSEWRDDQIVGLSFRPSVQGAVANWAALMAGKTVVNLDPTSPPDERKAVIRESGLRIVLAGDQEPLHVDSVEGVRLLDPFRNRRPCGKWRAAGLWLLASVVLLRLAGRSGGVHSDHPAAVVFSRKPNGSWIGATLTHFNLAANIDQIARVFFLGRRDRVVGVIPFGRSYGLTCTLLLPGALGIGAVYCGDPLDGQTVGRMTHRFKATILPASPELLAHYLKSVSPPRFGSLQYVISGPGALPEATSLALLDRFGLRPLEAYGCDECSPAVAVSRTDFRAPGFRQVGAKRGRVGHPLPGISLKVVDDAGQEVPVGTPGRLWVRGPNVMEGYWKHPQRTAQSLKDGWFDTGDRAAVDEDGFIELSDVPSEGSP